MRDSLGSNRKAPMTRKSPQEKKRLSYLKDRRNTYAENSKSSRRAIRRNKGDANRANRHHTRQGIAQATGSANPDISEAAETKVLGRRPRRWAKIPDEPLGQVIQRKLARRVKLGIDHPRKAAEKVKRVRGRTKK